MAGELFAGSVITLEGPLGSGKTTFVAGVADGLGIKERVISPTFNILKCYFDAKMPMFHIDAYRLENRDSELGLEEFIEGDGATLIEWPEYIRPLIPSEHLKIIIVPLDEMRRELNFETRGLKYDEMLIKFKEKIGV